MAMKPAGKALLIAALAAGVAGGAYYTGAFDKLKAPHVSETAPVPSPQAPVEQQSLPPAAPAVATPAPAAPAPQPQFGGTRQDAALDSLLGGKK